MDKQKEIAKTVMSVYGIITLFFIYLKITGLVNWSWWLVFLPLYLPILVSLQILIILYIIFRIETRKFRKKDKQCK